MEPEYYWLCFSGVNLAGQGAEHNFPVVFYGTERQAGEEAYTAAYQMAEAEVDEEKDSNGDDVFDDEAENMADYFVRKLNQKDLDSCGVSLVYEVIREINRNGDTIAEIEEKYEVDLSEGA